MNKLQSFALSTTLVMATHASLASPPSIGISPPKQTRVTPKPGKRSYWIGKPFIFLELPKSSQATGYSGYTLHEKLTSAKSSDMKTESGNLRYDKFAGKLLTLVDVHKLTYSSYNMTFKVQQTGDVINADYVSMVDKTPNLVPVQELQEAQKSYLGKTVYSTSRSLFIYDATSDEERTIPINFAQPLKVVKVVWGLGSEAPVWVIVREKSGQEGFFKVAPGYFLDDTEGLLPVVSSAWMDYNPKTLGYTQAIIDDINDGEVEIGMNTEQVEYALGAPDKKNHDQYGDSKHEQWIYSNRLLYFVDDKLVATQSL